MSTEIDYYELLECSRDANDATIKSSYRKLAMKYHPDKNGGCKDHEAKFKAISEAYDCLKDPQKRAAYDRYGHAAFQNGSAGGGPQDFGGFSDIFESVFGEFMGGRQQGGRQQRRGADLRYDMEITLEEAYHGKQTDITVDISPNMQAALVANELDLAFLLGPITVPSLVNRPLFAVPVAWIAAPGLVPDEEPLSLGALMRHPLITYPRATSPYVELRDLVLKANLLPSQIHTSASLATIVKMGVERLGICVIPPAIVRNELASGALRVLPTEQALSDLTFTATHAKRPEGHFVADAARIAEEVARDWAAKR